MEFAGGFASEVVDGLGYNAGFSLLGGLAIDEYDNIFAADYESIRKIRPDGFVTTEVRIKHVVLNCVVYSKSDRSIYFSDWTYIYKSVIGGGKYEIYAGNGEYQNIDGPRLKASFNGISSIDIDEKNRVMYTIFRP